jgi:hypothetical protein
MKKIAKYLKTSNSDTEKWVADLDAELKRILPKSFIQARFVKRIGESIQIDMTLGKDKSEWAHGIEHNDPIRQTIFLWSGTREWPESGMPELLKAENSGGTLMVEPEGKSMYAFDRIKLGWRNKTGNPEVIYKHIVDYVKKVKAIIKENDHRLPEMVSGKY